MISPKNKYIDIMNGIRIKVRENFDELYLKESTQITEDKAFNVIPFSSKK